jgi:hypothetical protein
MAKKYDAVKWVPGTWTNRKHDRQDGRHGHTVRLSGPNDPVLRMIHPHTPIDPEGHVGWWMVENWDPSVWYLVRVFTHRDTRHPSMGYRIRTTKEYVVEVNPFHHLGWNWYNGPQNYRDSILIAVLCRFRVREGTEISGYISDTCVQGKPSYLFKFRYRKELVRTTRI